MNLGIQELGYYRKQFIKFVIFPCSTFNDAKVQVQQKKYGAIREDEDSVFICLEQE